MTLPLNGLHKFQLFRWTLIIGYDTKLFVLFWLNFLQKKSEKSLRKSRERMNKRKKKNHNYYRRNMHVCTMLRPNERWSRSQRFFYFWRRWTFCNFVFLSYRSNLFLSSLRIWRNSGNCYSLAYFVAKYTKKENREKAYLINILSGTSFPSTSVDSLLRSFIVRRRQIDMDGSVSWREGQKWLSKYKYEECLPI